MVRAAARDPVVSRCSATVTVTVNATPVADANGPYTVDEGGTVAVDGSGSFDPDEFDSSIGERVEDPHGVGATAYRRHDHIGLGAPLRTIELGSELLADHLLDAVG